MIISLFMWLQFCLQLEMDLCGHLSCQYFQSALGNVYQGVIQGVASSFGSLASIIGLIIGGLLYNLIGGYTFLISAGIIFVVFIMSFKLLKL